MNKSTIELMRGGMIALLFVMAVSFCGCQWWGKGKGPKDESPASSSIYDDPTFQLPSASGLRTESSFRPSGISKEARELEARLGIK